MPGGAPEDQKMKDAFGTDWDNIQEHGLSHVWKSGSGISGSGIVSEGPAATYHAACQDCVGDGVSGGWMGPNRTSREQAQADADGHNQSHPGHTAMVL